MVFYSSVLGHSSDREQEPFYVVHVAHRKCRCCRPGWLNTESKACPAFTLSKRVNLMANKLDELGIHVRQQLE